VENIEDLEEEDRYLILARKAEFDGDRSKAIEETEKYLKIRPNSKDAWYWLGNQYIPIDSDKALQCYNKAIEIDPSFKAAYNQLAYLYNNLGDFDKSIWAINKYIEIAPDEPNPYDTRGELYARDGHLDMAIESYELALSKDSGFAATLKKLSGLYVLNGQYDKAEELFRKLIADQDVNTRANGRRFMSRIPTHQGRFKEAIRILDVGIEADKLEVGTGIQVAEKLWLRSVINGIHLKNYDTGISDLKKTIAIRDSINPTDAFIPHLMATMARFYAAKGDYDMANREVQLTKTRIEQNGSSDYRNYDLARAFVALEKGDSAEFAAIWKVHAKSRFLGSDYLMAISYYGSGRIGEAVQLLEGAMNYYGDNRANWPATSVKLHYWLGKCYEASGWNTKAIDEYETFLNIWKDADEGIAEVKDARERLTRLKSNS
jgi:tetratricopeptide (TPR) repeat protein